MSTTSRQAPSYSGFYLGLVAGAAAALVMLASRVVLGVLTPPELLLDPVTAIVPAALFSAVLDNLKFAAKPLFFGFLVMGQIALSGLAGLVYQRWSGQRAVSERWPYAAGLALLLWAFVGFVIMPVGGNGLLGTQSSAGTAATTVSLALSAAAFGLALWLVDGWVSAGASGYDISDMPSRRAMLRLFGLGTLVVAGGYFAIRGVSLAVANSRVLGGGATASLPPDVTPNDVFYKVSKNFADPVVDVGTWRLEITGMVDNPMVLSYDQLLALPSVERYVTLTCISNEVGGDLIGNALWKGVLLKDLLATAKVQPGVRKVWLSAADKYDDSIHYERALSPDNLLAYQMNGEPLPPGHGFPARLLVPGIYGMKNVKWITRINLVDYDYRGYWQVLGWDDEAVVKTMSRIDVPDQRLDQPAGQVMLGGVAFSGNRGIARVEVSVDGGKTWRDATLKPALSQNSWVLWMADWVAPTGRQDVLVRATDKTGALQISDEAPPFPSGASGYHEVVLNIVAPS